MALMIPVVTVWVRPKGAPTAITSSPTCSASESPICTVGRSAGTLSLIRITATSVLGSLLTTSALNSRLSGSLILISSTSFTTW